MPALLVIYTLWIVWVVSWIAAAPWSSPAQKRAGWKHEIVSRALVIFGAVLLFGIYSPRHIGVARLWQPGVTAGWIFVLITAAGFALAWWARIHLGRLWSSSVTRKDGHRIVDSGPYGWVRHPIYTGLILAQWATAAEIATVAALAGATIMTAGWYLKARLEEKFLRAELGADAYARYARKSAMLVPFIRF